MRLNKRLVELGLSPSRRKADEAIAAGQVMVNGEVAGLGKNTAPDDVVTLGGKLGETKAPIYVAFNKPAGYICSHAEQGNSKTIFALLPKSFEQLKIAGRLDKDSDGLVVLSSDGEFVNAITHPRAEKEKEYVVSTAEPMSSENIDALRAGVNLYDGVSHLLSVTKINASTVRVTLSEGRNRQIRRTFEQLGAEVMRLQRVRIAKLELGTLQSGKHRIIQSGDVL